MMIEALNMTAPAAALTGLYATVALLLLSMHLKSGWSWPIKASAIVLTLPATLGTFFAIQARSAGRAKAISPNSFSFMPP